MSIVRTVRYAVLALGAAVLLLPTLSFAHTFRSDGPVTVLLHVDPQDDPSTNGPSQLNFYVFDSQHRFLGANCICSVDVTGNGATILKKVITFNDSGYNHVAHVPIVWPSLGIYQITLVGKPKQSTDFHAFTLNYIQRVDVLGSSPSGSTSHYDVALLVFGGVIVVAAGAVVAIRREFKNV